MSLVPWKALPHGHEKGLVCKVARLGPALSDSELAVTQDNYGRGNLEAVQRVKKLYHELDLESLFKQYETDSHEKLLKMIQQQEILPSAVFTMLLIKIYKRTM